MNDRPLKGNDQLFSRDEALGGLPARRAAALLFLIESRTAHLVDRARRAMVPFRTEQSEQERELAFIEAFAEGRNPPLRPTIQDLERHALEWADLVPDNPRMRAAVAQLLGRKYQFTSADVPRLRSVLGLDESTVHDAYQRLFGEPPGAIYTERPSLRARLRWTRASLGTRLESLPPFWTAYSLMVTDTMGSGILALPLALAFIGPLPAIILLVLIGLVNVVTLAWIAESASRTASIRYGGAYFGRMVKEYLGGTGAMLLMVGLVTYSVFGLLAYSVGVSATLSSITGVMESAWIALLFIITGLNVSRGSMRSSVAFTLALGSVKLVFVFALALVAFLHMSPGNLTYMEIPGFGDRPLDLALVGAVFGVLLLAYFSHTSVGNCAAVVLQRDPSARALIGGVIAAQVTIIGIYSAWILAINGALSPEMLTGHAGTVLEPLAAVAGSSVYVVGTMFVIMSMGMGMSYSAGVLINALRDWFPTRAQPVVLLPRKQGRIVFEPRRGGPGVVLTYLGLHTDQPRLRLESQAAGKTWRGDHVDSGTWTARDVFTDIPDDVLAGLDLTVACLTAEEHQVRLRITSGMRMRYEGSWTTAALDLTSLLDAGDAGVKSDPDGALLRWMLRQGEASVAEAAAWAGQSDSDTHKQLRQLVDRGAVREVKQHGVTVYRANVARRRARHVPDSLQPTSRTSPDPSRRASIQAAFRAFAGQAGAFLHSDRGRRILEFSPLVAIALFAEWLVLTERASFTNLLGFAGAIAVPVIAGLFPALLLTSSRRKGDIAPGLVIRFLGRPWLACGIYAFFLVAMLINGLVVWRDLPHQAVTIAFAAVSLLVTALAIRRGAFSRRTVLTLREDHRPNGETVFELVSGGEPAPADVHFHDGTGVEQRSGHRHVIPDLASLRAVSTTLPPDQSTDIKIWANRISPQGELQPIPANVRLVSESDERRIDLGVSGGMTIVPWGGTPCTIEIELDQPVKPNPAPPKTARAAKSRVDLHALLAPSPETASLPGKGD